MSAYARRRSLSARASRRSPSVWTLSPTIAARGIRVDVVVPRRVVAGDENRVRQVFANLIGNGIKYAPPGTDVVVTARAAGAAVAVSVEDRGRGITEADLPFIFDEFFQAPERSEPGAGLGLAIARELTEAHGGRIDVSSRVGEGTCFTVTLPTTELER